jgi:hypothetical protein
MMILINLFKIIKFSVKNKYQLLEWIPYDRFGKVIYITEGEFCEVYRTDW